MTNQDKLEEIYVVPSDLRHLLHVQGYSLEEYEKIAKEQTARITRAAAYAREMLPDDIVSKHDEK